VKDRSLAMEGAGQDMLRIFASPARYVQGADATVKLSEQLRHLGLGARSLIVTSNSPRQSLERVWRKSFSEHGLAVELFDFGGECSHTEIIKGVAAARAFQATTIIGAGGGKTLDMARAVAGAMDLPIVCCPTTAASDAPCSALSVIYSDAGVFEKIEFYRRNPDLVLVDSAVIIRAPVRTLIAGMGDALATCFEARACTGAGKPNVLGGATTLAATAIAELCYRTLLQDGVAALMAAREGVVTPAFERVVEANTLLSGLGFESAGLAVAHSVHNGLTALSETHDFMHGEKVAFGTLVQLMLEEQPPALLREAFGFCVDVGLPVTLAQIGLDEFTPSQAMIVATRALAAGESAHNEPFAVTAEALADAIYAADSYGRAFDVKERRQLA
jgi:glycerol dehydrogenase